MTPAATLLKPHGPWSGMPTTRYQGSKRKILPRLFEVFSGLRFETCLDAFGGTGSVTHLLRNMKKHVTYSDILPSNATIARALFSPGPIRMKEDDLRDLFVRKRRFQYRDYISKNYRGVYYLDKENRELDLAVQNILAIDNIPARSEAFYVLFQAMLSKRPYNLFHRANLNLRTARVARSFGNKTTWEKPFLELMLRFWRELRDYRESHKADSASVRIFNRSAFEIRGSFDVVYIDTPYAKSSRTQESNYFNFYHFLDAMLAYHSIPAVLNRTARHKPVYEPNKSWHPEKSVTGAFQRLFKKHRASTLVLSYRSDGYPSGDDLQEMLGRLYRKVKLVNLGDYRYALSPGKQETREIVIVASGSRRDAF